jgi:dienelactone hydrolase
MGPFGIAETDNVGPGGNYTVIAPMALGQNGIKSPILVWSPGAGAWPAIYQTLLNHIASHGFVVVSYNSTAQGSDMTTGIDWIVSQATTQGSPYYNTVDTSKIGAGGQSAGSLAAFQVANDPRLTTTLHINGGTFPPHSEISNLVYPAQFICGDDPAVDGGDGTYVGDEARPNCDADFMLATTPVWYGDVIGASHTTIIDNPLGGSSTTDPLKKPFLAATVAWLRWQLAGDQTMKSMFVGSSCGFCTQTSTWTVQQKNL